MKWCSLLAEVFLDHHFAFFLAESGGSPRFLGTSCRDRRTSPVRFYQEVSRPMQIGQAASHKEAMRVLRQAFVADLAKLEQLLDRQKRMLNRRTHFRFGTVLLFLSIRQRCVALCFLVGEVLRLRCFGFDPLILPPVSRITPDARLIAMQQMLDHLAIMGIGRGDRRRVNHATLAVHANMTFHTEVPLVAFPSLVHLGVAFLLFVLGRGRCGNDGGIDDGAGGDFDAALTQVGVNLAKQLIAQTVLLQQVAELQDGGLVRCPIAPKINADKAAHGERVVERFLSGGVGEAEPLLQQVHSEHDLQPFGRAAVAGLGVVRLNQCQQTRPWYDLIHLSQKLRASCDLLMFLEAGYRAKCDLLHRFTHPINFASPLTLMPR